MKFDHVTNWYWYPDTPKDTEPWKSLKRSKCCNAESVESNLQTIQSKEKVGGAFMYIRYVNDSHF